MRKTIITLSAVALTTVSFGQKLKLTEAAVAYKELPAMWFMQPDKAEPAKKSLKVAKAAIDEAYQQQEEKGTLKTKDQAKLNYYRGVIYLDYVMLVGMDEEVKAEVEADPEAFEAVPFASLKKCKDLSGYFDDDIADKMNFLRSMAINGGVKMFDESNYEEAYAAFSGAVEMSDVLDYKDTVAMFNAGLSADKLDDFDNAVKYYEMAAEANYLGNAEVYSSIIRVLNRKNNGPSEEALAYIEKAKAKYPGDISIIIEEFNYHNANGNSDKAQESLQKAIEQDPRNPIFHFSIGATFDEMADAKHEEGKHDEAKTYADKAFESYKKSIELDPKYSDAYFNLGALHNNESYHLRKEISTLADAKLEEEKLNQANENLKSAIPYLEKCNELTPSDVSTLKLLKSIYFSLEMDAEYQTAVDRLKALGQ